MMNSQPIETLATASDGPLRTLRGGAVLPLGSAGGRLDVVRGMVWLTRSGDPDDHLLGVGQSLRLPPSGRVLIEAWNGADPALVRWQPGTLADRIAAATRAAFGRSWDIVDPARRIGAGSLAAAVALVSGALLFGPLSDARTRTLAAPVVLHNGVGAPARVDVDAAAAGGRHVDARAGNRERARIAAPQARRRPAGPA